jgi:hypothetical protein
MVPDIPTPLAAIVDFTVTSANAAGATGATTCDECDENPTLHLSLSRGMSILLLLARGRPGLAFFAHSFDQFSISATVCSTDSRAA